MTSCWQNIAIALGIKAVFLVLAVFGNATMWMAVFADMGASLLVVWQRTAAAQEPISESLVGPKQLRSRRPEPAH
jgi:cation transport ATPase